MVTDKQIRRLFALAKRERNQEIAAAKAGMDAKTARKYLRLGGVPSELPQVRRWRTRADPFAEIWEDARQLLEVHPGLEAKALFEYLQRQYPGRFSDGQLRTLQRRVKAWRATDGPAKEVFFAQQHAPGHLSPSDFTHMEELGITIQGQAHENGDIEQRHYRFKRALDQELLLRGSRDFACVEDYQQVLRALFGRLNAGRRARLAEEIAVMKELPERRMESYKRERVKVDSGSLIYADRNVYSVPSRWPKARP